MKRLPGGRGSGVEGCLSELTVVLLDGMVEHEHVGCLIMFPADAVVVEGVSLCGEDQLAGSRGCSGVIIKLPFAIHS